MDEHSEQGSVTSASGRSFRYWLWPRRRTGSSSEAKVEALSSELKRVLRPLSDRQASDSRVAKSRAAKLLFRHGYGPKVVDVALKGGGTITVGSEKIRVRTSGTRVSASEENQ